VNTTVQTNNLSLLVLEGTLRRFSMRTVLALLLLGLINMALSSANNCNIISKTSGFPAVIEAYARQYGFTVRSQDGTYVMPEGSILSIKRIIDQCKENLKKQRHNICTNEQYSQEECRTARFKVETLIARFDLMYQNFKDTFYKCSETISSDIHYGTSCADQINRIFGGKILQELILSYEEKLDLDAAYDLDDFTVIGIYAMKYKKTGDCTVQNQDGTRAMHKGCIQSIRRIIDESKRNFQIQRDNQCTNGQESLKCLEAKFKVMWFSQRFEQFFLRFKETFDKCSKERPSLPDMRDVTSCADQIGLGIFGGKILEELIFSYQNSLHLVYLNEFAVIEAYAMKFEETGCTIDKNLHGTHAMHKNCIESITKIIEQSKINLQIQKNNTCTNDQNSQECQRATFKANMVSERFDQFYLHFKQTFDQCGEHKKSLSVGMRDVSSCADWIDSFIGEKRLYELILSYENELELDAAKEFDELDYKYKPIAVQCPDLGLCKDKPKAERDECVKNRKAFGKCRENIVKEKCCDCPRYKKCEKQCNGNYLEQAEPIYRKFRDVLICNENFNKAQKCVRNNCRNEVFCASYDENCSTDLDKFNACDDGKCKDEIADFKKCHDGPDKVLEKYCRNLTPPFS